MIDFITCKLVRNAASKGTLKSMNPATIKRALDYEERQGSLDDESIINRAAQQRCLSQIPESAISLNRLRKVGWNGENGFHVAAHWECLNMLPQKFLTIENLLLKNKEGDTAFHVAARFGCTNQIPAACLNKQTITVRNNFDATPLHEAATWGKLDQIPKFLLDLENLLLRDKSKEAVYCRAARLGYASHIPADAFRGKRAFIKVEIDDAKDWVSSMAFGASLEAKKRITKSIDDWFSRIE